MHIEYVLNLGQTIFHMNIGTLLWFVLSCMHTGIFGVDEYADLCVFTAQALKHKDEVTANL